MKLLDLRNHIGKKQKVTCNVLISEATTSNGKPYLKIRLSDEESISTNIWANDHNFEEFKKLGVNRQFKADVEILFKGVNNMGYREYELHSIKEAPNVTVNPVDIAKLQVELKEIAHNIKDTTLKQIVIALIEDEELYEKFCHAPCSEQSAYSFEGGTLAHTVRVVKLCEAVASVFNLWDYNTHSHEEVSVDFLKTIAILHDFGKAIMLTVNSDGGVEKTFEGKLLTAPELSIKVLHDIIHKKNISVRDEQIIMLEHAIASSPGLTTMGALCVPRTKDALVFSFIEKIDVAIGNFEHMSRHSVGEEFQKILEKQYCMLNYEDI